MIKGEYAAVGGNSPKDRRRKKMLKRIHEYEKFVDNCQRYKEYERDKKNEGNERRHTLAVMGIRLPTEKLPKRSKSLPSFEKERATWNDRYSVPLLPDFDYKISLDERILLWQSMDADGSFFEKCLSTASLTAQVDETEKINEKETMRKRRSKSIDSWLLS